MRPHGIALKIIAALTVACMAGFWLWGQKMLDDMDLAVTPVVLVLPAGASLLCWAAGVTRIRRHRSAGDDRALPAEVRRARAFVLLGAFGIAWVFSLGLERIGHRQQSFGLLAVAATWDAGGLLATLYCAACLVGGGRRRARQ